MTAPEIVSFWCRRCEYDFDAFAEKYVNTVTVMKNGVIIGYKEPVKKRKWYEARCRKCGRIAIRHITDTASDPYFAESRKIKEQRSRSRKDLIQPGEFGFSALYPEQQKNMELAEERKSEKIKEETRNRDRIYEKYKHDPTRREIMKKAYSNDDR